MLEVVLNDGIQIRADAGSFYPSAAGIYSVMFGDGTVCDGVPVSRADFEKTGLIFSPHVVEAGLVFDFVFPSQVRCFLAVFRGGEILPLSGTGNKLEDYVIWERNWFPVSPDTISSVGIFIKGAGRRIEDLISPHGQLVDVGFYLRALREGSLGFRIEDRVREHITAARLSEVLQGEPPGGMNATLYPYQLHGFRWMNFMRSAGLGTLLADEMGLGKTLQVICLLQEARISGARHSLVIAPASILENWRRELLRFAPKLMTLVHAGPSRSGFPDDLRMPDVVIASYDTVVGDSAMLRQITWDVVVVDEAQNIKNPRAKRSVHIRGLPRKFAVAVTGTPVENSLTDIWSLVDFIVPGYFGPVDSFTRDHPDTIDSAEFVEARVAPLLLRRRVLDVAKDLPERIDISQPIVLDDTSARIYEELRQSAGQQPGARLKELMKLRQFCVHPWLVGAQTHVGDAAGCSVKLQRLLEICEELARAGKKALVFTAFQSGFDLLKQEISDRLGIRTMGIDGRVPVPERQQLLDQFQMLNGTGVLLLNPKAAGTGLNITSANYVIHFNLEWNPAVEDQATARSYRRGQQQRVFVYRLYYEQTVEEVMNDRMNWKRSLASAAVIQTDEARELADVMRALSISPVSVNRQNAYARND